MKKKNRRKILDVSWRVLLAIIVACAFSLVFIYAFFNGNEKLNKLLFSTKSDVSLFAPLIAAWALGAFAGAILTFWLFVKDLRYKDYHIENLKREIASLRAKLGKLTKEEATSFEVRIFGEINDPSLESTDATKSNGTSATKCNGNGKGNSAEKPFHTLQDLKRAENKQKSQQVQTSNLESQEPKDSEPKSPQDQDSDLESQVSKDGSLESQEPQGSKPDKK